MDNERKEGKWKTNGVQKSPEIKNREGGDKDKGRGE